MQKHIDRIGKAIQITFYTLFLTTPLAMHPNTSELFELNKMWLVYIYSIVIFCLWGTKILIEKKFELKRTPFDIPILLFLASQIVSTFLSMDVHTSFWGYYSRFNGGLLSTLCYTLLYFAFSTHILTNDKEESLKRAGKMISMIIVSGVLVALWGLPSHFGYDPTCLVFRGSLDVACWTDAFQPKIRMFSTLGQPNWLAAFLLILIPITTAFAVKASKKLKKDNIFSIDSLPFVGYVLASTLFYLDLGWTLSQSGFIGFWIGNFVFSIIFFTLLFVKYKFSIHKIISQRVFQAMAGIQLIFIFITFFVGNPIISIYLERFSSSINQSGVIQQTQTNTGSGTQAEPAEAQPPAQPALEAGITGSGEIRRIVWKGAIEIWKAYPLFGSGVETYAYAYYKFRPAEHNLTSEWDYLYNKAHNEFLNYMATTGTFGIGTYLLFIVVFLFFAGNTFFGYLKKSKMGDPILPALVGSFIGIQVSNFFGFSVVIVNLLMFLIPLFYWIYTNPKVNFLTLPKNINEDSPLESPGTGKIMTMIGLLAFGVYCIIFLINYWNADIAYGLGYNYNRINAFAEANPNLEKAVKMRSGEDLYKNELSINLAALAITAAQQQDAASAQQFATRAKILSDEVVRDNPNNVVYWKARTRVVFSLAELSPTLLPEAVEAIDKSSILAPTDAKIIYNQALIYDQVGRKDEALALLDKAISLKLNYRDAYYAKALFLSQKAEQSKDNREKGSLIEEAKKHLKFIIENNSADQQAKDLLESL